MGRGGRGLRRVPAAVRHFVSLAAAERRLTLRAAMLLLVVEATIRWVRLPTLTRLLGISLDLGDGRIPAGASDPGSGVDTPLPDAVVLARRCTQRVLQLWPFGTGTCLRESLVLGHLIRDREPCLRLGVARHHDRVRAHAWVEVQHRPVNDPRGFVAFGS